MVVTRRGIMRAAAGAAAAPLAAACAGIGGAPGGADRPSPAAPLPAELSWLGWSAEEEWLLEAYAGAANSFATKHPRSKLLSVGAGGGYREKYTTLVAAGTPPDVADVHWQQHVRDVGLGGLAIDLSPFLKRDAYPKDYLGWEPYGWQGKQYGVPTAVQGTGLFYNKALFDEAGVKYPDDTWTWEQFADAARRLTKPGADGATTTWGAADQGGQNVGWIDALLHAFGGAVFAADFTASQIAQPRSLEAIEFRASWGPRLNIAENVPAGRSGQFTTGKIAMATSGSWFVANVKRAATSALLASRVPWDVAPVPRGPVRRGGLTHELGIGIPQGAKHPDASWLAVRHLSSKEGLLPFAQIGRYIPPLRSLWPEAVPTDGTPPGFKKTFLDQWEALTVGSPFTPDFQQINPAWQEELDKVWTGERPARDGAAALARRMDEFLKQLKAQGRL
jgi:multiple sugar transport system substrate-binding protein